MQRPQLNGLELFVRELTNPHTGWLQPRETLSQAAGAPTPTPTPAPSLKQVEPLQTQPLVEPEKPIELVVGKEETSAPAQSQWLNWLNNLNAAMNQSAFQTVNLTVDDGVKGTKNYPSFKYDLCISNERWKVCLLVCDTLCAQLWLFLNMNTSKFVLHSLVEVLKPITRHKKLFSEKNEQNILRLLTNRFLPKNISFVPQFLVKIEQEDYLIEPLLNGTYVQFDSSHDTPSAFSHWTTTLEDQKPVLNLQGAIVDGQFWCTRSPFKETETTLESFKQSHKCNEICRKLGLSPF